MNFYKHYLGDYDGATAHLSWDEDMAYTRLLRAYYRREQPIPDAEKYRLCRAASKTQRNAVDAVLSEFFRLQDDGWHNNRADKEIEAYQAQASTNRRIAEARERKRKAHESLNEPCTNRPPVSMYRGEPNQNQIPEPERSKALSGKPDAPPLKVEKINGFRQQALEVLTFLNDKTGRHYEPVPANVDLILARLKEGVSVDDLRSVVAKKCREWLPDEKMAPYLRPATLFNRTKFAQYHGELGAIPPKVTL